MKAPEAILSALKDGPLYGIEIHERTRIGLWRLYGILRRMEREGVLTSYEVDGFPDRGGRPRRYYKVMQ